MKSADNNAKVFSKSFTIFFVTLTAITISIMLWSVAKTLAKVPEYNENKANAQIAREAFEERVSEKEELESNITDENFNEVMIEEARKAGLIFEGENVYIIAPAG